MSVPDRQGLAGALGPGPEPLSESADTSAAASGATVSATSGPPTSATASGPPTPPAPASAGRARRRRPARRRLKVTALVVAGALALAAAMYAIVTAFERQTGTLAAATTTDQSDDVELIVTMLSVDPAKNEVTVRLDYTQFGRYESAHEPGPAVDLEILDSSLNKPQLLIKRDTVPATADLEIGLDDDTLRNYPFDRGTAMLSFTARTADTKQDVPLGVAFVGDIPGYSLHADGSASEGWAFVEVDVSRSHSTIAWAMFVVVIFWLISGAVLTVWLLFLRRRRGFEFGIFIWCAGMLFAFATIRNSLPNAPPIGALVDFVSFFWAEALVCLTLVAAVVVYAFRRHPPP